MTMKNAAQRAAKELGMRNGVLLALAAAVFAACSMNGGLPGGGGGAGAAGPVAVRFASDSIAAAPDAAAGRARAAGSAWETGDAIGVYMVGHGNTDVAGGAANVKYTTASTAGAASFSPVDASETIYYPVDAASKVDFIAYYPHQGTLAGWAYKVDVGTQASQPAIDLMWSGAADNGGSGYDKTQESSAVALEFAHRLVKLELAVTNGDGVSSLDGLAVAIKGMKTTADFDVGTGALGNESGAADIVPLKGAGSYKYEAILLPAAALDGSHKIEFAVGGNTYAWNLSGSGGIAGGALEAGKKYAYTVTVKKHSVGVSGTIVGWGDGGSDDADTTE